jgi:hypothetical protein
MGFELSRAVLLAPHRNPAQGNCTLRLQCPGDQETRINLVDPSGAAVRHIAAGRFGPDIHRFRMGWMQRNGA